MREWRTLPRVRDLWKVEARLQAAYLLRFPAWFIWRERKALGRFRFDDESFFFGETPYDVAIAICTRMGLGPDDVLYDLGCGRGKMVFTAHLATGCQAVGVDLLPTYVETAGGIARALRLDGVRFEREDMLSVSLDPATAVYVNGFTFSDDLAAGLHARISALPDGVWWTSVGRSWDHPRLYLQDTLPWPFSWGRAVVWFYKTGPAGKASPPGASRAQPGARFDQVLAEALGDTPEEDET